MSEISVIKEDVKVLVEDIDITTLNDEEAIKYHNDLMVIENLVDAMKIKVIKKLGELYIAFDGTVRECAEYYGVSKSTVSDYTVISNQLSTTDGQAKAESIKDVSKNKLLNAFKNPKPKQEKVIENDIEEVVPLKDYKDMKYLYKLSSDGLEDMVKVERELLDVIEGLKSELHEYKYTTKEQAVNQNTTKEQTVKDLTLIDNYKTAYDNHTEEATAETARALMDVEDNFYTVLDDDEEYTRINAKQTAVFIAIKSLLSQSNSRSAKEKKQVRENLRNTIFTLVEMIEITIPTSRKL